MENLQNTGKFVAAKTGRKLTKFICGICGKEQVIDKRKRDKYKPKFEKHVRKCLGNNADTSV